MDKVNVKNPTHARQAIVTRYAGPTNNRGSIVTSRCQAGSARVEWDDGLNSDTNHTRAATKLAAKLGWHGDWTHGVLPDGRHVFCMIVSD